MKATGSTLDGYNVREIIDLPQPQAQETVAFLLSCFRGEECTVNGTLRPSHKADQGLFRILWRPRYWAIYPLYSKDNECLPGCFSWETIFFFVELKCWRRVYSFFLQIIG